MHMEQEQVNEQDQASEQKQPPYLIYAVVVTVILAAVVWLVLIPEQKEPRQAPVTPTVSEQSEDVDMAPKVPEQETTDYSTQQVEESASEQAFEAAPEMVEPEAPQVVLDDAWAMSQIVQLVPERTIADLIIQQDMISNFVVFIDNASRGELVTQFSPLMAPKEKFAADQSGENLLTYQVNTANFSRYDSYANLLVSLPVDKSVAVYKELTPTIDEAHMELGYEAGTFDRKLKRAMDFLIDAPVLTDDVKLVAPSAMYQFADAELEGLLAIQKLLLRMGPDNQQKVRAKLIEFRAAL